MPDELIRARHTELGVVTLVPDNEYYRDLGWQPVDEKTPTTAEEQAAAAATEFHQAQVAAGVVFDPSTHSVEEVNAYLAGDITDDERTRVLEAERAGKGRKTVLGDDT